MHVARKHAGRIAKEEEPIFAEYRAAAARMCSERTNEALSAFSSIEERIVQAYTPLVKSMLRQLGSINPHTQKQDLQSAGNEGLLIAMRRYDPKRGNRFATYARPWIKNRMLAQVRFDRWPISIPESAYKRVFKVAKTRNALTQEFGREPTLSELAERMRIKMATLIDATLWLDGGMSSLDALVGEDGHSTLADFIGESQTLWGRSLSSVEPKILAMLSVFLADTDWQWQQRALLQLRIYENPTMRDLANALGITVHMAEKLNSRTQETARLRGNDLRRALQVACKRPTQYRRTRGI